MSLNSPLFFALLLFTFAVYHSVSQGKRHLVLLAGSAVFLTFHPVSAGILFALGLLSYFAARSTRLRVVVPAFTLISILTFVIVRWKGWDSFGLNFFVLFMIGYVLDVWRGRRAAESEFVTYISAVSAFPYVSAGPLPVARNWLPQIRVPALPTSDQAQEAFLRIAYGLAKKATGDQLAHISDRYFGHAMGHGGMLHAWIATLALAGQYYADLSGYTDIAIGTGQLLGLQLPENFRCPYFAASVAEHWRRWHISVNEWFKEYVFTPLFVRRWPGLSGAKPRLAASLLATMLLIGLWHELTWNYLLWGLYNGILILTPLPFGLHRAQSGWRRVLAIGITFYLVLLGRLLTRTENLEQAWLAFLELHTTGRIGFISDGVAINLGLTVLALIVPHVADYFLWVREKRWQPSPLARTALTILLLTYAICFGMQGKAFLYEGH